MQLGSPRWGTKELPKEYSGRTCPWYSYVANIARCRPIYLNKRFEKEFGRGQSDHYRIGKEFGTVRRGSQL